MFAILCEIVFHEVCLKKILLKNLLHNEIDCY